MDLSQRTTAALLAAAILCVSLSAQADDAPQTQPQTQQCIRMSEVDHTTVIDGKTILVTMKRDAYRRIDLAVRCMGLAVEEAFSFSMQTYELCKSTPLHVLNGGTCIIDKIVTIDKAEAKALRAKR